MNKSSFKNFLFTLFGLLLIVSSCSDLGCFDAGDDGSEIKSLATYLLPLNENSVSNPDGTYRPLTGKKEEDFYYTWKSLQYNKDNQNSEKDDGGPKEDFYVYTGKRVSVAIDGSIMLAGFKITEDLPLEIQKVEYTENGGKKEIYTSPIKLLPIYVNPGEKVIATYLQKGLIPKVGGIELKNGLGVFIALVETEAETVGRYGNHRKWTCNDGMALANHREGYDNITNCSDVTDYTTCSPSKETWCSGFHSAEKDQEAAYGEEDKAVDLVHNSSLRKNMSNLAFFKPDLAYYAFGRAFGSHEYGGINIASGTADKDSRHDSHGPTYPSSAECSAIYSTGWTQLKEFAICTHDFSLQGWSANHTPVDDQKPQMATMSGQGPITRWYFADPSTTCEELDKTYGIKNISGLFGGPYNYVVSGSRVYWPTQHDNPKIECDNKDNGSYYCNEVSSFSTRRISPKICPNNTNISAKWPLQVILVKTGLADNSPLNRGINTCTQIQTALGTCSNVQGNCTTTLRVQSQGQNYQLKTSGGSQTWNAFPVLLQEGEKFDITSTGTFTHGHDHVVSTSTADWYFNLYPAQMYSDVAGHDKPCSSITLYAVQPLTFVSCFARYQNACSNQRVPNAFCKETRDDGGNAQTATNQPAGTATNNSSNAKIFIGSCTKKYIKSLTDVPQAYKFPDYKRINTLTDVPAGSIFSEAENIEDQHCGICAKKDLDADPSTGLPIVKPEDMSDSSTIATITNRDKCETSRDYQWITSFYDNTAKEAVSLIFFPNKKNAICPDSESQQLVKNKIRSLTNIVYHKTMGLSNSILYGGLFSNLGTSGTATIEIPNNNKRYFVIAGYSGNGDNFEQLFTEQDAKDNLLVKKDEKMKQSEFVEKTTGTKPSNIDPAKDDEVTVEQDTFRTGQISLSSGTYSKNGESVYVYIQEFKKNADGSYTSEPDPNKHPAKVFGEKTHPNTIIQKMSQDTSIPIREYTTSYDMLDGSKDGLALWRASLSGKLWFAIMDHKPQTIDGRTDGRYITFSRDKDGDLNPKVKDGLSNVLYWNSGKYKVIAKTESTQGTSTGGWISDKINTVLVEFIKQIFFGRRVTDDQHAQCKTVLKPKPQDDTPTDNRPTFLTTQLGTLDSKAPKPPEDTCKQGFAEGAQNIPFPIKEQPCQSCARLAFNDPVREEYVKLSKTYLGPKDSSNNFPCTAKTINGQQSDTSFDCDQEVVDACTYNGFKNLNIVNAGVNTDIITVCPRPTPPPTEGTIIYQCKNATKAVKQRLVDEDLVLPPYSVPDQNTLRVKECTIQYSMGCLKSPLYFLYGTCEGGDRDISGELKYGVSGDSGFGTFMEREITRPVAYDRIVAIESPVFIQSNRSLGPNTWWCKFLLNTNGLDKLEGAKGNECATECYEPEWRSKQLSFSGEEIFYNNIPGLTPKTFRNHLQDNTALTVGADAYLIKANKEFKILYRTPARGDQYYCYLHRNERGYNEAYLNTTISEKTFSKTTQACRASLSTGKPIIEKTINPYIYPEPIRTSALQNSCSSTAIRRCTNLIKIDEKENNSQTYYDPTKPLEEKAIKILETDPAASMYVTVEVKSMEIINRPQYKEKFNWCHLKDISGAFSPTEDDLKECGRKCYGDENALTQKMIYVINAEGPYAQKCQSPTSCQRSTPDIVAGLTRSENAPWDKYDYWSNWQTSGFIHFPQYTDSGFGASFYVAFKSPDHTRPDCPDAVQGAKYRFPLRVILQLHTLVQPTAQCLPKCVNAGCPSISKTVGTVLFDQCTETGGNAGKCSNAYLNFLFNRRTVLHNDLKSKTTAYCVADALASTPADQTTTDVVTELNIPAQPSTCNPVVIKPDGSTQLISKIIPLKAKKYGNCKTSCPADNPNCLEYQKLKKCQIFRMFQDNNPAVNIFSCMSKTYTDTTCWEPIDTKGCKTSITQCTPQYVFEEFEYPNDDIQDDDFTKDSVSPGCTELENKPFKTFSNCTHTSETFQKPDGDSKDIWIKKCDITRTCHVETVQKEAKMMPEKDSTSQEPNLLRNGGDGSMFRVNSCKSEYLDVVEQGTCSEIKNLKTTSDISKVPGNENLTQAQLNDTLKNLQASKCRRQASLDCKECKRPSIKGNDSQMHELTQISVTAGVVPMQYGCTAADNSRFYCESTELITACTGSGTGTANITFPSSSSDNVTICDKNKKILETITEVTNQDPYEKSYTFLGQDCDVDFKCFSQKDTNPTNPDQSPTLTNAGLSINDDNKYETIKVCTSTRAWKEGFIYTLFISFTTSFHLQAIIYLIVILLLTMKGYGVLLGNTKIDQTSMVKDAITMSIVIGFFSPTGWDLYEKYVISAILDFMDDVNSLVTRAMNPGDIQGRNPFGPIDDVFNAIFLKKTTWYRVLAILFGQLTGFIYIIAILFSFFSFLMIFTRSVIQYLSNLIMLSMYLSLGPLFILFKLHPRTATYFTNWWQGIMGFLVAQFYLFSIIALFTMLYLNIVEALLYFKVCYRSIITIPVVNISILGWFVLADEIPANLKIYFDTFDTTGTSQGGGYPSLTELITLLVIVATMEKFVTTPLFGGKDGRGSFFKELDSAVQKFRTQGRNLASSAAAKPFKALAGAGAKGVGKGLGAAKKGGGKAIGAMRSKGAGKGGTGGAGGAAGGVGGAMGK